MTDAHTPVPTMGTASEADGPEAQTQSKEVGAKAVSGAWSTGGGPAVTTG